MNTEPVPLANKKVLPKCDEIDRTLEYSMLVKVVGDYLTYGILGDVGVLAH